MKLINDIFTGDDNKTYSFSRIMSAIILFAMVCWCSFTIYTNKTLPDLLGVAAVLTGVYGVNRVSEAFVAKSVNDNAQPKPTPTTAEQNVKSGS